jgi:hypothetical protein
MTGTRYEYLAPLVSFRQLRYEYGKIKFEIEILDTLAHRPRNHDRGTLRQNENLKAFNELPAASL